MSASADERAEATSSVTLLPTGPEDQELAVIHCILTALQQLTSERARTRVLAYVMSRQDR